MLTSTEGTMWLALPTWIRFDPEAEKSGPF
jgi:hypothetical protein